MSEKVFGHSPFLDESVVSPYRLSVLISKTDEIYLKFVCYISSREVDIINNIL